MRKILFVLTLSISMFLLGCTKNQQAVNKLEGTWELYEVATTFSGTTVINHTDGITVVYNKCKLSKDDWCNGENRDDGSLAASFEYRVTNSGNGIEVKNEGSDEINVGEILELTNNDLVTTFEEDGSFYEYRLRK